MQIKMVLNVVMDRIERLRSTRVCQRERNWTGAVVVMMAALVAGPSNAYSSPADHPASFNVQVTGHGQPMVLIPGLSSSGDVWKTTVAHYQGQYTCYVLTLAGFAGVPPIAPPVLSTVREDLAAYIQAKHLTKPVIVGHSLGGSLALDLAGHHPDLVGPVVIVDSLPFLAGAWFQAKTLDAAKPMIEQMHTYLSHQTREQYDQYVRSGTALKYMVTSPADLETITQWGLASDPASVTEAMVELVSEDTRPELGQISAPTLVLGTWRGLSDQLKTYNQNVPREGFVKTFEDQYASLPHLHFSMSDTARHFMMYDDPNWFFAQLDAFLADPLKAIQDRGFGKN
jgi:N-formylmaleamate deformylase